MTMEILRDKYGKPQGTIREIAGGQQRLYDNAGQAIATYRPNVNFTYDLSLIHISEPTRPY